jgi:AcrR family transcriptional regulator
MNTPHKILKKTAIRFAQVGYEGLNIRSVAHDAGIAPSVIYHYFEDKDALLKAMFLYVSKELGKKRAQLAPPTSPQLMMRQRVEFQIDHAAEVVAVLKYYLHYRDTFDKTEHGFVPDTAYLHIKEVLEFGLESGEFEAMDVESEAKVITHAINGFLLEYYPYVPTDEEKKVLVDSICRFILRSIVVREKQ